MGRNIHNVLDERLIRILGAMEQELKSITPADVKADLGRYLAEERTYIKVVTERRGLNCYIKL